MNFLSVARDAEPVIRDVYAVMFGDSEKLGAEARELLYGQAARSERSDELSRAIEKANEQPSVKSTSWFTERSDREDAEVIRSGQSLSSRGFSGRDKELELWNPPNPNESDKEIRVAQGEFNSWSGRATKGEAPWNARDRVKDLISEEKFSPMFGWHQRRTMRVFLRDVLRRECLLDQGWSKGCLARDQLICTVPTLILTWSLLSETWSCRRALS